MQKKRFYFVGGGGGGGGGQGGCLRRTEAFFGGRGLGGLWGVRVDMNKELEVFVRIQKKKKILGGGGSGWM